MVVRVDYSPILDVLKPVDQYIEINGFRGVEIKLILESCLRLFRTKGLIERILLKAHHELLHVPSYAQYIP